MKRGSPKDKEVECSTDKKWSKTSTTSTTEDRKSSRTTSTTEDKKSSRDIIQIALFIECFANLVSGLSFIAQPKMSIQPYLPTGISCSCNFLN